MQRGPQPSPRPDCHFASPPISPSPLKRLLNADGRVQPECQSRRRPAPPAEFSDAATAFPFCCLPPPLSITIETPTYALHPSILKHLLQGNVGLQQNASLAAGQRRPVEFSEAATALPFCSLRPQMTTPAAPSAT